MSTSYATHFTTSFFHQDIYNIRALPYIIGTSLFNESPDAGLGFAVFEPDAPETQGEVAAVKESAEPNEPKLEEDDRVASIEERTYREISSERNDENHEDWEGPNSPPPPPPAPVASAPLSLAQMIAAQANRQNSNKNAVRDEYEEDNGDPEFDAPPSREEVRSKFPPPPPLPAGPPPPVPPTRDAHVTSDESSSTAPPIIRPILPLPVKLPSTDVRTESVDSASKVTASKPEIPNDGDEAEEEDLFASQDDPYNLFSNRKSVANKVTFKLFKALYSILIICLERKWERFYVRSFWEIGTNKSKD